MIFKRKQLTVIMLAVLICLAGYLNLANEDKTVSDNYMGQAKLVGNIQSEEVQEEDFFASARLEREIGRSKSIETFNEVINNANSDEKVKNDAQNGIMELADNTETETTIENLIKAKGFEDAVCYINNSQANIVVKCELLDEAQVAIITEIVTEQSSIPPEKIKVMEIK